MFHSKSLDEPCTHEYSTVPNESTSGQRHDRIDNVSETKTERHVVVSYMPQQQRRAAEATRESTINILLWALENNLVNAAGQILSSISEENLLKHFTNVPDENQPSPRTVLHRIAATKHNAESEAICRKLLEKIKDSETAKGFVHHCAIDEFDCHGPTRVWVSAIHAAAYHGNTAVVRALCEAGVDVNSVSCILTEPRLEGLTALHWAAWKGRTDVVRALLNNAADANACASLRVTTAGVPDERPPKPRLQGTRTLEPWKKLTRTGGTALYVAAEMGHADIVRCLVDNGADVDATLRSGATPLYVAAQRGRLDIVKYLIENGADVNAALEAGAGPLYAAAAAGHGDVVKCLLDNGADVTGARRTGATPLFVAAQTGSLDSVVHLTEGGANVNAAHGSGATALYVAAQIGRLDIVRYLVDNGADVKAALKTGATPQHVAAATGHYDVAEYLAGQRGST